MHVSKETKQAADIRRRMKLWRESEREKGRERGNDCSAARSRVLERVI